MEAYHAEIIIHKTLWILSSCPKVDEVNHFGALIVQEIAPVRIGLFNIQ